MAASNPTPSYQIPNGADSSRPFTFLNIHNTIKLQSTNYLSWKLQVEAILIGHDLFKFIDGSFPCPPPVITTDGTETSNPDHAFWIRQDKLLFGALFGTLSQPLAPLIARTSSSHTLWETLAKTYALPSRGHRKQLKDQINRTTKAPPLLPNLCMLLRLALTNSPPLVNPWIMKILLIAFLLV